MNTINLQKIRFTVLTAFIVMMVGGNVFAADEAVVAPDTLEEAESNYWSVAAQPKDDFRDYQLCLAERQLARVKMVNFGIGKIELSDADVERLVKKQAQECVEPEVVGPVYSKLTAAEDQNQYVRLASMISGNDLDFILTLEQENGLWTPDRFHGYNTNGTADYGFCGLNSAYHMWYIDSPAFHDPKKLMVMMILWMMVLMQLLRGCMKSFEVRNCLRD